MSATKDVAEYYERSDAELARRYLKDQYPNFNRAYFEAALAHRYGLYPHIPDFAEFGRFQGRDVLEVGVGQGADHYMFASHGARLVGIDLTQKHCDITRLFLATFGLKSRIARADARHLPFSDACFDHVYSCGVLLLFPEIEKAISEIRRVLRPGGSTTIMLYNKKSIHYWIKTRMYYGWALNENAVLGRSTVLDWYTDGIGYPKTHHYAPTDLRRLFARFAKAEYRTACLSPEQVPLAGLPRVSRVRDWLEDRYGFFLWVKAWK